MKYTIDFDNNKVEETFMELEHLFYWSERCFEDGDLGRNIVNTVRFEDVVKELRLFRVNVEVGTFLDDGFLRIGYALINGHRFVRCGKLDPATLKVALWEIAHPAKA